MINDVKRRAQELDHVWDRLAIDWPTCNQDSVVWEVGAYRGRWAYQMATRYNPWLCCFEPQKWAYDVCTEILRPFSAEVFNYGLWTHNCRLPMSQFGTDGAKITGHTEEATHTAEMRDMIGVYEELYTKTIDIMMVNIEKGEYQLIPYMLECGIKPRVLMVQIHDDKANSHKFLTDLISSHYGLPKWDYGLVLSCWGDL